MSADDEALLLLQVTCVALEGDVVGQLQVMKREREREGAQRGLTGHGVDHTKLKKAFYYSNGTPNLSPATTQKKIYQKKFLLPQPKAAEVWCSLHLPLITKNPSLELGLHSLLE